jgi:hypothetical protein
MVWGSSVAVVIKRRAVSQEALCFDSRQGQKFYLCSKYFRPDLQPIQSVSEFLSGAKSLDHKASLHVTQWSRMSGILTTPPYALVECTGKTLPV